MSTFRVAPLFALLLLAYQLAWDAPASCPNCKPAASGRSCGCAKGRRCDCPRCNRKDGCRCGRSCRCFRRPLKHASGGIYLQIGRTPSH